LVTRIFWARECWAFTVSGKRSCLVKTVLTRLLVFCAAVFFSSCGNKLLDFANESNPGGGGDGGDSGGGDRTAGTTEVYIPYGTTPIYIDTQAQFDKFCKIGSYGTEDYPLDGYYILRGNGVAERTFYTTNAISEQFAFTGTLTGWFTPDEENEDMKTTVKIDMPYSLFKGTSMQAKTVSWLKFEAVHTSAYSADDAVGIVAAKSVNTRFEQVTVAGKVDVNSHNWNKVIYVGGIVGSADGSTKFEGCKARATVTVKLESSSGSECYIGGIAGFLEGSVVNSGVATVQKSTYPPYAPVFGQISVTSTIVNGDSKVYAGGVAGKLTGSIETSVVRANVTATGQAGAAYSGGYAGFAEGGTIKNNKSEGSLTVDATSGVTSAGNAYAGGLVGESAQTGLGSAVIVGNHLTGTVSVTSKYYDGASYSGGLAGSLLGTARIESSSVNGSATIQSYSQASAATPPGKAYAGGLAGYSDAGCTIAESFFSSSNYFGAVNAGFSNSYLTGPIAASEAYAGGIAGYARGAISKVYSNAVVDNTASTADFVAGIDARISEALGIAAAGGIAGKSEELISESYAVATVKARAKDASAVTGGASAGGISGISFGSITNTFALAKVDASRVDDTVTSGKAQAGGIAGYLADAVSVTTSYAAGSVMAFGATASVYAGGIAGHIDGSSATAAIEKCVALQQYIASTNGATNFHRVAGIRTSTNRTISDTYAYSGMKPQNGGLPFEITTPSAVDADGAHISATDAKDFNYYTGTLSWNAGSATVWSAGGLFPVLTGDPGKNPPILPPPSVPSWAQIP
jgi:hypothetical protein